MALSASDAAHFCRRVGFGGTTAEIDHFTGREINDVVTEVLGTGATIPSMPGAVTVGRWYECRVATVDWWVNRMAAASWVDRTTATPSPLVEKLALFWHSHFACGTPKTQDFKGLWRQLVATWRYGLGDFETLTREIALGGAMLVYFDNHTNVVGNEQENYARELMELHTIGVGNFTEADVVAMAKAWTGHTVVGHGAEPFDATYVFVPDRHDNSQKTLFGITKNWDGPAAITELVKGTGQGACARFLAAKLWRYFVDDEPSDDEVTAVAAAMVADGMKVRGALRAILTHPRFWAPETRWAVVRQPAELAVDLARRFSIDANGSLIAWTMLIMGQGLFWPLSVNGWGTHEYWISTTGTWGRARLVKSLRDHPNVRDAWDGMEDGSAGAAANRILDALGITEASAATVASIKGWFNDVVATQKWGIAKDALYMGAMSPEFQLA
jgi:uncharacterized protein (DUF1800 family)